MPSLHSLMLFYQTVVSCGLSDEFQTREGQEEWFPEEGVAKGKEDNIPWCGLSRVSYTSLLVPPLPCSLLCVVELQLSVVLFTTLEKAQPKWVPLRS